MADIDVTRHGILPNDPALATANTSALRRLLDPGAAGPVGNLVFPAARSGDVYHFNGMVQVRAGIHMDLRGKSGSITKSVFIMTDRGNKTVYVRGIIADAPGMNDDDRQRNLLIAKANRQAVFKGECASCQRRDCVSLKCARPKTDCASGKTGLCVQT